MPEMISQLFPSHAPLAKHNKTGVLKGLAGQFHRQLLLDHVLQTQNTPTPSHATRAVTLVPEHQQTRTTIT